MQKTCFIISLLLLLFFSEAKTQTVFSGRVTAENGNAVERASVILRGEKGKTIAFSTTSKEGNFTIKLPEGKEAKELAVNHIGLAQIIIPLSKYKNGQTITMKEKPLEIKEVTVKSKPIRLVGDTLTYSVAGFMQKQDKYIEDVIARLPGVNITPQGKITYQGKEINHFYVEGMDLMGEQYAQVTRNLTADKVQNVQVYENHQPVKMQRNVTFSEQAAINIQLKDDAKNLWLGTAEIGSGLTLQGDTEWLRDARVVGMYFGREKQSLNMYKTNNTGKNIAMEVRPPGTATKGLITNLVSQGSEQNTFSDAHIVATNWLFKTSEDKSLRMQVSGLLNKLKKESYTETQYNDVEEKAVITEAQSRTAQENQWNLSLDYHQNASNVNVQNTLTGYVDFDKGYGTSLLNGKNVQLDVKPRHRSIRDNMMLGLKLNEKRYISLNLSAAYSYLPATMLLFNGSQERLDMKVLSMSASTSLTQVLAKGLSLVLNVGGNGNVEMMNVVYDTTTGHDRYSEYKLYAYPSLEYNTDKLSLSLMPSMNLLMRSIGNEHDNRVYIDPSMRIDYKILSDLNFYTYYKYSYQTSGSLAMLTKVPYYSTYNYLAHGMGEFTHNTSHLMSMSIRYRHVPSNLFIRMGANGTLANSNLYSSQMENGIDTRPQTGETRTSRSLSLNGGIEKRFFFWMANASISGGHTWNRFYTMMNDEVVPVTNRAANISGKLSLSPVALISIEMNSSVAFSWQQRQAASKDVSFRNYSHNLSVFFFPGKWQIGWKAEYAYGSDKMQTKNLYSDASVQYRTNSFDAGIYLNNIFSTYEQRRRTITQLAEYYSVTYMRPRELLFKLSFNL